MVEVFNCLVRRCYDVALIITNRSRYRRARKEREINRGAPQFKRRTSYSIHRQAGGDLSP